MTNIGISLANIKLVAVSVGLPIVRETQLRTYSGVNCNISLLTPPEPNELIIVHCPCKHYYCQTIIFILVSAWFVERKLLSKNRFRVCVNTTHSFVVSVVPTLRIFDRKNWFHAVNQDDTSESSIGFRAMLSSVFVYVTQHRYFNIRTGYRRVETLGYGFLIYRFRGRDV